ncbi:FtsX-like permease family protein [Nonomuraea sp. 10N515B]|uniref:FtsX-like permease family protein n=1 Tax=Nonomuraea sp. 10N515B TaxID=3457422 RepID=UPI003FCEA26C
MSSLLTIKLRRDLRASWPRFVMMVIAIAVSLTVFGGMLAAWASIGRETSGAYMSTAPASATIVLEQGITTEQMAAIATRARQRPGVLEATGRTQFNTEVEVNGRPRDIPLQVFAAAPDDPMRMVRFDVQNKEGTWPLPPGDILVRPDTLTLLNMAVGDTLTVKTPSGQSARLRVAGTVYDPSLAPSPQQQTGNGYLSTAALSTSGQPVLLDQLKIQVAEPGQKEPSRDRDAVVAVAGDVGEWLQREQGLTIREIQVPEPYAHPHQFQADVLLLSLLAGGTAALLLSTILVANMLNNLFTQQIPQIGIMKAIGAQSGRIGRLYLTMTLLVAAAATLLALGPAILIGQKGLEALLGMLGIQAQSLAAPWWAYTTIIAAGLGLPPLMALLPLVNASRTTVRAALDHHGLGSNPSAATGVLAPAEPPAPPGPWPTHGAAQHHPAPRPVLAVGRPAGQRRHGVRRRTVPELRHPGGRRAEKGAALLGRRGATGRPGPAGCGHQRCAASTQGQPSRGLDPHPGRCRRAKTVPPHPHLSRPRPRQHRPDHGAVRLQAPTAQPAPRPLAQPTGNRRGRAQPDHPEQHCPRPRRRRHRATVHRGQTHHLAHHRHPRGEG